MYEAIKFEIDEGVALVTLNKTMEWIETDANIRAGR